MAASLIVAGIAAGTSIYAAHKGAAAAKDAAKQQQAGAREARAYGEPLYQAAREQAGQIYQQGQAGLAPYTQQGTQGLYALSDFLGVPRAPAQATPAPMAGPTAAPVAPNRPRPPDAPIVGQAVPRPGGPIPRAGAPATAPQQATQSSYVTLRAPTGQVQPVPAEHVDYYLARGATRV